MTRRAGCGAEWEMMDGGRSLIAPFITHHSSLITPGETCVIIGTGIDIVDLNRMQGLLDRHGNKFLAKTFTDGEIAYCQSRKKMVQHFAGRFAAKEAVFKALGTGWRAGMGWKEIEVQVDSYGRPHLRLLGKVAAKARDLGISEIFLSISHCDCHAVAFVIAQSRDVEGK